jgi:hypothetical protein
MYKKKFNRLTSSSFVFLLIIFIPTQVFAQNMPAAKYWCIRGCAEMGEQVGANECGGANAVPCSGGGQGDSYWCGCSDFLEDLIRDCGNVCTIQSETETDEQVLEETQAS